MIQHLLDAYSWRGALLILSGIVLNFVVCGALIRDLEWPEVSPVSKSPTARKLSRQGSQASFPQSPSTPRYSYARSVSFAPGEDEEKQTISLLEIPSHIREELRLLDKSRRNFKSLAANLHREDSEDYEKTQTVKRPRFPSWHPSLESLEAEAALKKDSVDPVAEPQPPLHKKTVPDDAVSLPEHEVYGNLLRLPKCESPSEDESSWGNCRANSMTLPPPVTSPETASATEPIDGIPTVTVIPPKKQLSESKKSTTPPPVQPPAARLFRRLPMESRQLANVRRYLATFSR